MKRQYSRAHQWSFDGGATVQASAAPSGVPEPYSNPANVDPEEAFVAAISSCHMLTFLFLASGDGIDVRGYYDEAVGYMKPNEHGALCVSDVELSPKVVYGEGVQPTLERERKLHHLAHETCYISNSVKTQVSVRLTDN